jgi:hypothetical protein
MVPIAELLLVLVMITVGVRWYLRTPMHRARKHSGVFPAQVGGHLGFGMYSPSNPPLLPHALNDHRHASRGQQEPDAGVMPEPGDA